MYAIREIAKDKPNASQLVGPLLSIRLTAGLVAISIYSLCLLLVDMESLRKLTFLGCGLYLAVYALYTDWVLKGLEKVAYLAAGTLVSSVFFLGGTLFLVKGSGDVATASFVWSLSYLPGAILVLYCLQKRVGIRIRLSLHPREWWSHIKGSIWFALSHGLMIVYQNLPVVLLGGISTSHDVGIYASAYRIILTAYGASYLIYVASYPVLSDTYANDRQRFKKVFLRLVAMLLSLSGGAGIVCTLFAPQIIALLLGDQYRESVAIFRILIWLLPLFLIRDSVWTVLSIQNSFMGFVRITLAGILALSMGGFIMVRQYGTVGVASAFLAVEVFCVGMLLTTAKREKTEDAK
jgi:O-antigen/teichoic acid export membrane protein